MAMTNTLNSQKKDQVNLVDLFFYLLRYWYIFLLCILVACAYAYYRYEKTPFTYRSSAQVIIKNPSNSPTTTNLARYSELINRVNLSNEMMTFRSKTLMAEVVKALDLDVSYTEHQRLRDIELYNRTPVKLWFSRHENPLESLSVKVIPKAAETLILEIPGEKAMPIHPGDTVTLSGVPVLFQPTGYYSNFLGRTVHINKIPVANAAATFSGRLTVTQTDKQNAVLTLTEQDFSLQRAKDILVTLVDKYNESAVQEKEDLARNTAEFINERLAIIEKDLTDVEMRLANFKRTQRVVDVNAAANNYLNQSNADQAEIIRTDTKISQAEQIKDFVQNTSYGEMIPVQASLDNNASVDKAVAEYNAQVLRRRALVDASSENSPAVRELESSMQVLKQNIVSNIDNLIASLKMNKRDLQRHESESLEKFSAMPTKALEEVSIERQQKIKEQLFLFLLNKREENALTQAMVEDNARMVDTAVGSSIPIYPSKQRMLLIAFLIGLLAPAVVLLARLLLDNKAAPARTSQTPSRCRSSPRCRSRKSSGVCARRTRAYISPTIPSRRASSRSRSACSVPTSNS